MSNNTGLSKSTYSDDELAKMLSSLPDVGSTFYLLVHLNEERRRLQKDAVKWEESQRATQQRLIEVDEQITALRRWLGYPF